MRTMSNATHLSAKRFTSWEPKFLTSFTKVSTVAVSVLCFGGHFWAKSESHWPTISLRSCVTFYFGWCLFSNLVAVALLLILVDAHIVALVGLNSKYSQCNGHTSFSSNLDKSTSTNRAKYKNKSPVSPEILPIGCTTVS